MTTLGKSSKSKDKNKHVQKATEGIATSQLNKISPNISELASLKDAGPHTLSQSEAINNAYALTSNYAQVLLKYKSMAGKHKSIKLARSPKKAKAITQGSNSQGQDQIDSLQIDSQRKLERIDKPLIQQQSQKVEAGEKIVEAYKTFRNGNKTYIKFLAEKQHESHNLNNNETPKQNLQSLFEIKHILKTTKRVSSLPVIIKPTSSPIKLKNGSAKQKPVTVASPDNGSEKTKSRIKRIQKEKALNTVAFLLNNVQQKISEGEIKSLYKSYKPEHRETPRHTFLTESPRKTIKSKPSLLEFSNSPSSFLKNQSPKKNNGSPIQSKKQDSPTIPSKQNENISNEVDISLLNLEIKKTSKEKQMNAKLEEIKQDIENQNNEKQQLLKQHRAMNKNLQITVLEKRQKITQLQAELDQYESLEHNQSNLNGHVPAEELQLAQLYQVKANKEKLFKDQKNKLKDEISKIEKKILQQQSKFNNLRETEIRIKGEEIAEKEKQMEKKNKEISEQLLKKRKQLEEAIEKQKEKSRIYRLELEEQSKKNAQISIELKKQEQLQELLLQQIEKMVKERRKKAQRKQQQKKRARDRLLEEIKQLEETQNRLLMEYQRDSQSASSIFEAMRLKNLELEQKIKRNKRQDEQTVSLAS